MEHMETVINLLTSEVFWGMVTFILGIFGVGGKTFKDNKAGEELGKPLANLLKNMVAKNFNELPADMVNLISSATNLTDGKAAVILNQIGRLISSDPEDKSVTNVVVDGVVMITHDAHTGKFILNPAGILNKIMYFVKRILKRK